MTIAVAYSWILRIIALLLWIRAMRIQLMPEKERNEYFIKRMVEKSEKNA